MTKKRVVVGISGGVDSSVSAYLLQKQGYEVIGLFMKNWHDESVTISNECPWLDDSRDALLVAQKLGIPFQTIDLSAEYKERIVDYMFAEYEAGRTPNPDVLCNREIKFDVFLEAAMKLKADYVATGHYCRRAETTDENGNTVYQLLAGVDGNKDQSYFLCQLNQEQLSKALFPIGELTKPEVREIARELDLVTAEKKDSQGLCFVGKIKLPDFLKQQLLPKTGKVVEIPKEEEMYNMDASAIPFENEEQKLKFLTAPYSYDDVEGIVKGDHQGAHFYTIGQRKGLNIGGTPEPLFVIATDVKKNIVYTGQGGNHPGLLRPGLFVANDDVHWIREDLEIEVGESVRYMSRIRYRQDLVGATIYRKEDGLYIIFDEPERGVASGQFVAWYDGDELIGSGVIA
ncbi:tRNA (5-methylaminomethyl-2-thiouridylate)-methyltransferase [Sediminitomix flava]|uniref:tRNA-specific 2-thiouridylase MnmA n=2 Tax=Sediminitomix flava TaxID=379075 RepID=A0A315ZA13_SEDFL|nr:tRNA (5-methylaminomethyl-2-thiouridylate)-methyltransferase [Sediminitomix flava]